MVALRKKVIKGQTYYYLEHSYRKGKKVLKKELYLGNKIPKNIENIKRQLIDDIYKEKWYSDLDIIKKNYNKEHKSLPKSVKEKKLQIFVTEFTYDTQKIEGSTLTRRETAELLERGITPAGKPIRDVKEAEAHRDLFYRILKSKKDLTLQTILDWHWDLFSQTKADIAGKIRKYQVEIGASKFLPPSPVEVFPMLTEFFQWYNKNKNRIHPIELAALTHLKFVTIHPFGDGNGRISRLIMNFVLNKKGYPMLNIKYDGRTGYYNALERSQIKNEERIFLQWFLKKYINEYHRYLR
ncbi:MAG TPA: Fic family protein [Candidatus Nitrosotenuis sp.]|nr:Fic family protein [Candidatus Nitrosotenuis sp.]